MSATVLVARWYRRSRLRWSREPQAKLDAVDEAIIAVLQEDGRRSLRRVGEAVGLSEAATRQRINRLRDSGVMRIVGVTDPVALGRGVVATIGLRVSGDTPRGGARLAEIAAVEYVVVTAGSFDVIVEVVCGGEEELLSVINEEHPLDRRRPGDRDIHAPAHREERVRLGSAPHPGVDVLVAVLSDRCCVWWVATRGEFAVAPGVRLRAEKLQAGEGPRSRPAATAERF